MPNCMLTSSKCLQQTRSPVKSRRLFSLLVHLHPAYSCSGRRPENSFYEDKHLWGSVGNKDVCVCVWPAESRCACVCVRVYMHVKAEEEAHCRNINTQPCLVGFLIFFFLAVFTLWNEWRHDLPGPERSSQQHESIQIKSKTNGFSSESPLPPNCTVVGKVTERCERRCRCSHPRVCVHVIQTFDPWELMAARAQPQQLDHVKGEILFTSACREQREEPCVFSYSTLCNNYLR